MYFTRLASIVATTLSFVSSASADPATYSSSTVSTSIALVQNGSDTDLYMRLSAPESNGWGGVAIGEQMRGALFFILYPSSDGSSATVSVRTATSNRMPREYAGAKYQVTDSSIENGMMSAEFVCYSCSQWDMGSLDMSSSQSSWLWAHGPSAGLRSDSTYANIAQHPLSGGGYGDFTANVQAAQYSSSSEAIAAITGKTATSQPASNNNAASSDSSGDSISNTDALVTAHATLLTLTFYFFLPAGVLLLRLVPKSAVRLHYIAQATGTIFAIIGLGIAIYMSKQSKDWAGLDSYHQVIGILVVVLLLVQAALGIAHHLVFMRTARKTPLSWSHIGLGWIILILGGMQGILGGKFAGDNSIAGGLGALMVIVWIVTAAGAFYGRRKNQNAPNRSFDSMEMKGRR